MITGIVVALPEELSTLTSKKIDKGCCVFIADHIVLAYSGAGIDNARTAAELLVTQGATRLISWGCAAALSTTLKPGDLVLPNTLIDADGNRLDIQSDWLKLTSSLKAHTGCLAESLSIVATAKDKKSLHSKTGAIAVDMESIAIAKVALQHNLSFLAIRAIADPVDMDLPKAISHSFNSEGDIVLVKLLGFVALHPAELPGLIKLGLHFNAAKNTLKSAAKQIDLFTAAARQDQ